MKPFNLLSYKYNVPAGLIVQNAIDEIIQGTSIEAAEAVNDVEQGREVWIQTESYNLNLNYDTFISEETGLETSTYRLTITGLRTPYFKLFLQDDRDIKTLHLLDLITERHGFCIGTTFYKYFKEEDRVVNFPESHEEYF